MSEKNSLRERVKRIPLIRDCLRSAGWKTVRHAITLRTERRDDWQTFTRFIRAPAQFDALAGPVVNFLDPGKENRPLEIAVLGCSTGAEAYSVAMTMMKSCPGRTIGIRASDINADVLKKARTAAYAAEEVYSNNKVTPEFVAEMFDRDGEMFVVKKDIAKLVTFELADATTPGIEKTLGRYDIVFAQNFLFNLPREVSYGALPNFVGLLKTPGALFVDGVDLDIRARVTKQCGLEPLDYRIEDIHCDAGAERFVGWPYRYWGLEPYSKARRDGGRRYATIFLRRERKRIKRFQRLNDIEINPVSRENS